MNPDLDRMANEDELTAPHDRSACSSLRKPPDKLPDAGARAIHDRMRKPAHAKFFIKELMRFEGKKTVTIRLIGESKERFGELEIVSDDYIVFYEPHKPGTVQPKYTIPATAISYVSEQV
jgi:hypothetical protein